MAASYTALFLFLIMKILLLAIGKTDEKYLETGIKKYVDRMVHYVPFEIKLLPDLKNRKNLGFEQQKQAEKPRRQDVDQKTEVGKQQARREQEKSGDVITVPGLFAQRKFPRAEVHRV